MSRSLVFPALSALLLLGACATATPYQAATEELHGYENQKIERNRWQVSFGGNALTDRQTVETYLLYRAAELTLQQGFDHFRVVRRETDGDSRTVPTGFSSSPFYSGFHCDYRFYTPGSLNDPAFSSSRIAGAQNSFGFAFRASSNYREIVRYEATAEIMMGHGAKPLDGTEYFDAEDVLATLGHSIVRPETDI